MFMKEYIKYVPLSLFVAFCVKSLVVGVTIAEAPALAIVAVFSAYLIHRDEDENKKAIELDLLRLRNNKKLSQKKWKICARMYLL